MDFGIAKSAYDAQLTGARTIVGTPYYMSPEQCTPSRTIDLRSDIYGLGATLYHMVTGEFPFDGDDPMEIVRRQIFDPMPSPKIYNPDLSDHLGRGDRQDDAEVTCQTPPVLVRSSRRTQSDALMTSSTRHK